MNDDSDSLFGSRASSPVAGHEPVPTALSNNQDASSSRSSPIPRRLAMLKPPTAPTRPSLKTGTKRKRNPPTVPKLPVEFPQPGQPVPPHFLRNHSAVLGLAGQVAGMRLPDPIAPGTSAHHPIVVHDIARSASARRQPQRSAPSRPSPSSSASTSSAQDAGKAALRMLEGNEDFIGILRALLAHATMQKRGVRAVSAQPRFLKKRRLSTVPAGAQHWDVPFPFDKDEGPEEYKEKWEEQRGARLVGDLVSILSDAVKKSAARLGTPAASTAPSGVSASLEDPYKQPQQHAISSSVQGWLDSLSVASPVASTSDGFQHLRQEGDVDSLQSLMDLYDKQSDGALYSALFGTVQPPSGAEAFAPDFGCDRMEEQSKPPIPTSGDTNVHGGRDVSDFSLDELVAFSQVPWPTPDPSEHSGPATRGVEDEDGETDEKAGEGLQVPDLSSHPTAWEDVIKSLLSSLPPSNGDGPSPAFGDFDASTFNSVSPSGAQTPFSMDSTAASMFPTPSPSFDSTPSQLLDFAATHFDANAMQRASFSDELSSAVLPPTPTSLATPVLPSAAGGSSSPDVDVEMATSSFVDPLSLSLRPMSRPPVVPASSAFNYSPPVVQSSPTASLRSSSPSPAPSVRLNKLERKSELLARATTHRARLAAELERVKQDIWGCTVEDGVLHHLQAMK